MGIASLTDFEKIRKLRWQLAGNAFNTISCATNFYGGSMFVLFLDELKLDATRIGFLLSLLPFFGITSLFTAPYIARIGFKRTFVGYAYLRLLFVAMLLATPAVLAAFGAGWAFVVVALATGGFSLIKAFGETAMTSWQQELVPNVIRGKFTALTAMIQLSANAATIFIGGMVIGMFAGLSPYMILIGCGLAIGLISAWCYSFMPGGTPIRDDHASSAHFRQMFEAVTADRNYRKYIIGMMLVFVGFCVSTTFVPLFMKNEAGLTAKVVIWLDIAAFIGGIASSYLWGWAADRYGSKPVMLMGPLTMAMFPIVCFLMPRNSVLTVVPAMLVPFIYGAAGMAWNLGLGRYLYVTVMPPEKRTAYGAVYYACLNLSAAIGIFSSGALLNWAKQYEGSIFGFALDGYITVFAIGMAISLGGLAVVATLKRGSDMPIGEFLAMFVRGNPLAGFWSLFKYRLAKSEPARIKVVHKLGHSGSPLNNRELICSLKDPCLNVCIDAVMAIALRKPEPVLVDALVETLDGGRSQLGSLAAWALGRMHADAAIPALRKAMLSADAALRCAAARAIATLNDTASIQKIGDLLRKETKLEERIAYAFSLGHLKAHNYCSDILKLMADCKDATLRQEAALSAAMLIGREEDFVALWRRLSADFATGAAQALWSLKKFVANRQSPSYLESNIEAAAAAFAQNDISQGASELKKLIDAVKAPDKTASEILAQYKINIDSAEEKQKDYILLAIHTIAAILKPQQNERNSK